MNTLLEIVVSIGMALGSLLGLYHEPVENPLVIGAEVQPIAGVTYTLSGSGVSSSATSIILSTFTIPQTGQKIQDSDLSSTFYVTLEPGNRSRQELASCTTVTQNANGTATLSGCSRGLSPVTPYTASSTLQFSHAGGTQVIFSNPPQLYNQFAAKANNETITGQWTFDTFPITPNNGTSSESVAGVSQLATGAQAAASTATSTNGTNAPLVLPSKIATSTYNSATAGNVIPVTGLTTKTIDENFLPATTTKQMEFTATTTIIGDFPAWHIGKQVQVITTTGTSTFAVPSGITKIFVEVQAGGGTGGTGSGTDYGSGGGGGGGYANEMIDVTGTTTIQLFVGAANEPSKFGTNGFYLSATQGSAGTGGALSGAGGAGGCGSGGDVNICGSGGGAGSTNASVGGNGGAGGGAVLGGGGQGVTGDSGGGAGQNYGGGGAGGSQASTSGGGSGGSGAQGVVIVRW